MSKNKIHVEIGKRINIARERSHYTQEVLAEKIDLSTQYLSDIERGATGMSIATLIKLCEALHVSSDYLLFGENGSKDVEENFLRVLRMSKEEQKIINQAINTTIQALTLHDE